MVHEATTTNTGPSKSTTKKTFLVSLLGCLVGFIVVLPVYEVGRYADILLSQAQASPRSVADCGVVLTGAAGRIREGITLLSHHQVLKLIISGVHQHSTLSDMFPELLFYPEIKLDSVILERRSSSTSGNAQQSLPIVEALNCQSILLVTHDYHMYRALKTFNQIFPPAIKIIPYAIPSDRLHRRDVIFDSRFWGTVLEEWCKYLFYSVFVFNS